VAVIKDGYLQQVDTPQTLYNEPTNVFVAAFIGSPSMNLYEATLDGTTLRLGSQTLTLDAAAFDRRPALRSFHDKKLIVGIRPEDFEDASLVDGSTPERRLTATVNLTEALGSDIMVHFAVDAPMVRSGDPDAAEEAGTTSVGRFDPRSRVRLGDVVEIAVTLENLHYFDPDTRLAVPLGISMKEAS
jgi:multiple sugar transport system ATP-binding protein